MRRLNNGFFSLYYRLVCIISQYVTWFKFKINDVAFINNFTARGVPILYIARDGKFCIGNNFQINSGALHNRIGRPQRCSFVVDDGAELIIGDNVGISSTAIVCKHRIQIGSNVRIGGGVVIYDTNFHSLKVSERTVWPENKDHVQHKAVIIEDGAFIGAHSMILKGVTVGKNSIVGAGSVVSKSIPPNEIWAGNPAKLIKAL